MQKKLQSKWSEKGEKWHKWVWCQIWYLIGGKKVCDEKFVMWKLKEQKEKMLTV